MALEYQKGVNLAQVNMDLKCYFGPNVYRAQNVFEIQELLQMHCTWHNIKIGIIKAQLSLGLKCTVKLGNKERFDKEQIGIK